MSAAIYKSVTNNAKKESNSPQIDSNNPQVGSNYPTNKTSSSFGAGRTGNIGGGVNHRINYVWMAF